MRVLETSLNKGQTSGFLELTHGIDIDQLLWKEELRVQEAWGQALAQSGHLTEDEFNKLRQAFSQIRGEMEAGTYNWAIEDEDIHMSLENAITKKFGDVGKKLHLGRSRNDLIATTVKLHLAEKSKELASSLRSFVETFLKKSTADLDVIIPSYTHMQAAQPIRLSHYWNYHALNLLSDIQRFSTVEKKCREVMPLGSGAISGTHLKIDLNAVARQLGFQSPPVNSMHGVSDRDFVLEFTHAVSMLGLHISRLCEDIIVFSSTPIKFFELPVDWSSGSSMMPNKRNPDFFEVVRAKSKRWIAKHSEAMLINVTLPSGYSSDFHEQKRTYVGLADEVTRVTHALAEAVEGVVVDRTRAELMLKQGNILATDLANQIVAEGKPFREAYKAVADAVTKAEKNGEQLSLKNHSFIDSVEAKTLSGGTSKRSVQGCLEHIRSALNIT